MIDDDRIPDLHRMYTLFGRPGVKEGLEALKTDLKKSIQTRGSSINAAIFGDMGAGADAEVKSEPVDGEGAGTSMQEAQNGTIAAKKVALTGVAAVAAALRWVQDILDLKDKFERLLKEAFEEDKGIQVAINEVRSSLNRNVESR